MPAENPPAILRSPDRIGWKYIQTFADYEKMQQFLRNNRCNSRAYSADYSRRLRLRASCSGRKTGNCKFMLMAMKTTTNGYHVYKHGVHKHKIMHSVAFKKKQAQRFSNQQVIIADEDEEGMEESEEGIEAEESEKEREEEGKQNEDDGDKEEDEDDEENGEEQPQQEDELRPHERPPKKIVKKIKGQPREYRFLKTVKSVDELDTLRFENHCYFLRGKSHQLVNPLILYCARTQFGVTCAFQLMAIPSADLENGAIHVYAHSQHSDHPFLSAERRARIKKGKELMPAENPPTTYVTPENIKWQFVQTFDDYDKMHKFRLKNQCQSRSVNRIRAYCKQRWTHNCPFMFLALKTTKEGYHLYKHGQHKHKHNNKHPTIEPKQRLQPARVCRQLKREENMHNEEEEEEEADVPLKEDGDEEEYSMGECEKGEKDAKEIPEVSIEEEKLIDERIEQEDEGGDEDEEEEEEVDDEERGHNEIEEQGQHEDEAIEEVPNAEQEDGIPVIEDEQQQQQQQNEEVEKEESIKKEIIESPREATLEEQLAKANEKVYKWMAGIEPQEIGRTLGEWDNVSLLKMVEMADQEIRENPEKLNLWLPWLKCAIPKCSPQIEGFNVRFKALIKLTFDSVN